MVTAREDLGYVDSDREINALIKAQNSGARVSSDPSVLEKAAVAALTRSPLDGNSVREVRQKLSRIRSTGWPVDHYSHLSSEELKRYLGNLQGAVMTIARESCPDILKQITEENQRVIREVCHY